MAETRKRILRTVLGMPHLLLHGLLVNRYTLCRTPTANTSPTNAGPTMLAVSIGSPLIHNCVRIGAYSLGVDRRLAADAERCFLAALVIRQDVNLGYGTRLAKERPKFMCTC